MQYILINSNIVLFNPRALWANPRFVVQAVDPCFVQDNPVIAWRVKLYIVTAIKKKIFVKFIIKIMFTYNTNK